MPKVPPTPKKKQVAYTKVPQKNPEEVVCEKCGVVGHQPGVMHDNCDGIFKKRRNLPWGNPYK